MQSKEKKKRKIVEGDVHLSFIQFSPFPYFNLSFNPSMHHFHLCGLHHPRRGGGGGGIPMQNGRLVDNTVVLRSGGGGGVGSVCLGSVGWWSRSISVCG